MAFANGYAYRMTAPVANPTDAGDRALDAVEFPAAFLLAQGRIVEPDYADYLVTTASGTTLRSSLNATNTALYIDYPSMPQGRGEVYIYYGKSGATAPDPVTFWTQDRYDAGIVAAQTATDSGTLVDAGFEDGIEGATLDTGIWTVAGSPQNREYDDSTAAVGTQSAYIRGAANNALAGVSTPMVLSADDSELRFWVNFDNTTGDRRIRETVADTVYELRWNTVGAVQVYTQRTATGYTVNDFTQIGTYTTGWMQYQLVFDFATQTYTVSRRASIGDAWTPLKASGAPDYNIPMRASATLTATTNALIRSTNSNMWLDDLRYSNTPITTTLTPEATPTALAFSANHETTSASDTGGKFILSGEDVEALYIESTDAFRGAESVVKVGIEPAPDDIVTAEIPQSALDAALPASVYVSMVNLYGRKTSATTYYRAEILYRLDITSFSVQVKRNSTNTAVGTSVFGILIADRYWRFTASGSTLRVFSSADGVTWTQRWTATDSNIAGPGDWYTDPAGYEVVYPDTHNHGLVKFFEGALKRGTITAARLKFNATGVTVPANTSITAHRFKTATLGTTYGVQHIATGWGGQDGAPTWTKRLLNRQPSPPDPVDVLWQTAGATHANEIDTAEATLSLTTSDTTGWKSLDLPAEWFNDWINTDDHTNGFLLKPSAECLLTIDKSSVVLEVEYSAFAEMQYDKRKVTTDTSWVTHPYAGERLIQKPTDYMFGSHLCMDPDMRLHLHWWDTSGRVHRAVKSFNVAPPGFSEDTFYWKNWPAGLHYDPSDGRYWIMCGTYPDGTPGTVIGYSEPHMPTGWTWSSPATYAYASKSGFAVRDGVAYIGVHYGGAGSGFEYLTYTRATDTWSSPVTVMTNSLAGLTERTLAAGILNTDTMDGAGVITLNGAPDSYPVPGVTLIDSEVFWYTGKSGNTLTGVTRAWFGTSAATHSISATANLQDSELGAYLNIAYDEVNDRIHATFTADTTNWGTGAAYTGIYHVYHNLADADGVWKDAAGNTLTLPLNISNLPRISGNDFGAWNHNLITLSDGTTIATYGQQNTKDSLSGLRNNDAKYRRLNNAGLIDIVDVGVISPAVNMSDLGSGRVVFAGVEQPTVNANADRIFVAESGDSGASILSVTSLDPHTLSGGYIWEPTMTERADASGKGMLAYHHLNYHGAVYFQQVEYVEPTYRPRRQRMAALGGF